MPRRKLRAPKAVSKRRRVHDVCDAAGCELLHAGAVVMTAIALRGSLRGIEKAKTMLEEERKKFAA